MPAAASRARTDGSVLSAARALRCGNIAQHIGMANEIPVALAIVMIGMSARGNRFSRLVRRETACTMMDGATACTRERSQRIKGGNSIVSSQSNVHRLYTVPSS
eukprot:m.379300 g.379300  ORF g.379300 m.379300 type:complete len:104 (-) comp20950_c0_seq4:1442-1753(-)